jgi:hypothetical protein
MRDRLHGMGSNRPIGPVSQSLNVDQVSCLAHFSFTVGLWNVSKQMYILYFQPSQTRPVRKVHRWLASALT